MEQDKRNNSIYDLPDFLPFTNDNIFMNVMRSPKICRGILELVLPNEEFGEIRMMNSKHPFLDDAEGGEDSEGAEDSVNANESISSHNGKNALSNLTSETQKTLKFERDAHGVRFDAFIKSERLWAEIEMHTGSNLILGKRARYYHANMDLDSLEQGVEYDKLKPSYVIFICTFDYYGNDKPVYFFRSWDKENSLPLDDFSFTIILNSKCSPEKVPEALKPFYAYLNDPNKNQASELTRMIDERVRKFNSDEWRKKYMTFEYMLNERERKGIEQGIEQGRSEGEAIGEAKKQREIAKNFKESGIPIEVIAENTGLSCDEIEKL